MSHGIEFHENAQIFNLLTPLFSNEKGKRYQHFPPVIIKPKFNF